MLACNKMLMQKLICLLVSLPRIYQGASYFCAIVYANASHSGSWIEEIHIFIYAFWLCHVTPLSRSSCCTLDVLLGRKFGRSKNGKVNMNMHRYHCLSLCHCFGQKLWPAPEILDEDQTSFGVNRFSRKKSFSVIKFVWRPARAIDVLHSSRK